MTHRAMLAAVVLGAAPACINCVGPEDQPPVGIVEPPLVATVPVPPHFGLHDTFVRDGIAFLCAWKSGLIILDVGNGIRGGTPAAPVEITTFVPTAAPLSSLAIHNAWWFHNPVRQEQRYLFLGQEGPVVMGAESSGDLKVLDVSDLAQPREVATYHVDGAGTHNFWMDEARQILYIAYYNAGVVALDVSGVLSGDLRPRELARVRPGGQDNTFVWGVMLASERLYASDMMSGLWQLDPTTLQPVAGGNNVPERFGSDLWVRGGYAYTGTWYNRGGPVLGNVIKVWALSSTGAPTLADSIVIEGIAAVTDLETSDDGKLLMAGAEGVTGQGLYWYRLNPPSKPELVARVQVANGIHTASFARINGRLYAFAARNPSNPALEIYDLSGL
jgi:hypothetical protein